MWRALVPVLILAAATEPATELPLLPAGALGPVEPLRFNRGPLGGDILAGCVQLELGVDTQGAVVSARIQQSSRRREIDRDVLHGIASIRPRAAAGVCQPMACLRERVGQWPQQCAGERVRAHR